jgi:hypothetical protein
MCCKLMLIAIFPVCFAVSGVEDIFNFTQSITLLPSYYQLSYVNGIIVQYVPDKDSRGVF